MKNITKLFVLIFPAFLFFSVSVIPSYAVYMKSADNLTLPKGQKIDEAALVTGSTITVDSDINGDLYCAGREITVNGNVKGDIACMAQNFKLNGTVDGNIRVVAQTVDVSSVITRNLTTVSQQLILEPKSQVKGDIFFGAQAVNLNGTMGRDLAGAGETVTISGSLLRNAAVTGSNLSVIETGKIGGNLDYYMEKTATASIGAKNVKGNVTRHEISTPEKTPSKEEVTKVSKIASVTSKLFSMISIAIVGLILIYFNRKKTEERVSLTYSQPVKTGLIGFVTLIVFPVAFFLSLMTVIGIPLAFIVLFVYIIALITASLYPSIVYGRLVLEKIFHYKKSTIIAQMFLGVFTLGLISWIPVIGWAVAFISFCIGLGAVVLSYAPEKN